MRAEQRRRDLVALTGADRLHIFVPAVMSVGLVFWLVTEVIELVRARAEEIRDRRAAVAASYVADAVLLRPPPAATELEGRGFRPRAIYVMTAVTLLAVAVYVFVGSAANYVRSGGYVGDIAWILSLASATSIVALLFGVAALVVAVRWPASPPRVTAFVLRTPLGTEPLDPDSHYDRPSRRLTASLIAVGAAAAALTLVVPWGPQAARRLDQSLADWLTGSDRLSVLAVLDPLGETGVAIALALLAGLAAFRCRVLAASFAMSTAVGLFLSLTLRPLVAQPRPGGGPMAGSIDSYPSGHVLLAVLMAGLIPLALAVLFDRTSIIAPLRAVLGVGVAASAVHRVASAIHWPSDALGGALIGGALVLATQWAIDNHKSHRACHHCPWSADPHQGGVLGAVPIHPTSQRALRLVAHLAAAAAVVVLTLVTSTIDLPVDADGYTLGRDVQTAVQLGLAATLSIGALLAWRWDAAGAIVMALAATGLGVFSAVEYPPVVGVGLTVVAMVPAVLLWLSWQHRRRPHEVVTLAVVTAMLVAISGVGASVVYDEYFGATHPDSVAVDPGVDEVEWMWIGGLSATEVTVTARLDDRDEPAHLHLASADGVVVETDEVRADRFGMVRMTASALVPDTEYAFQVVVEDDVDRRRGVGRFRTPAEGAFSFTFTAGACARTSSTGAVFDAIGAEDPLLHLALGDMHYENLETTDAERFVDAFGRALSTPGQGALARAVPMAYIWDDHDYGANDADATSPSRSAARAAYRSAVPHYGVPEGDAAIYQAFTIGRVRFVLTDTRSERRGDTMFGDEQLRWFLDEVRTASATHAAVVWVNGVPWIGEADLASDGWAGAPGQRTLIADALVDAEVDNLVMVSGDAHMVAIDDGTNSDYSTSGTGGFPLLHAAALDRPGNAKGGPYSHGEFAGHGQYGVIDVIDDGGDEVTIRLAGRTWDGETLVEHEHHIAVG